MKKRILLTLDPKRQDIQYLVKRLQDAGFDAYAKLADPVSRDYVQEAKQVDAALVATEPWDREALAQVKNHICCIMRKGTGYDSVDVKAASEFGIPVMNIPGANATAVAEIAFTHILNCSRQFSWSMEKIRQQPGFPRYWGNELDTATVGIIGYGNIGRELARMLSGFRSKILVYDACYVPQVDGERITVAGSMEEVFEKSDYISLHIPLTPQTTGIIDRRLLNLMKPSACLINTSRGGVVNDADLVDALRTGRIRGAGLDVLGQEPLTADSPYYNLENAFITPHIGGDSEQTRARSNEIIIQTFVDYFSGKPVKNIVNKDYFQAK